MIKTSGTGSGTFLMVERESMTTRESNGRKNDRLIFQPGMEEYVLGEGRFEVVNHPDSAETLEAISIFRYPGGKSKLLKRIVPLIYLPDSRKHTYIEPFVGGGSVALAAAQKLPSVRLILNDRDKNIFLLLEVGRLWA
jgi:hypothetical protein